MTPPCYTQNLVYEDVDREAPTDLGMTVLENPQSFLEVNESATSSR